MYSSFRSRAAFISNICSIFSHVVSFFLAFNILCISYTLTWHASGILRYSMYSSLRPYVFWFSYFILSLSSFVNLSPVLINTHPYFLIPYKNWFILLKNLALNSLLTFFFSLSWNTRSMSTCKPRNPPKLYYPIIR